MKIDATILLIQSYSAIRVKVDENIDLKDFMEVAGLNGHVLCSPRFFLLKDEKPLEGNEDGFFIAIRLPKKKGVSVAEAVNGRYPKILCSDRKLGGGRG